MRKILGFGILVLCFACTSAFAGGSGNCIQPLKTTTDRYGVGAGFGYNYVNDRLLHLYNYNKVEKNMDVKKVSQIYGMVPVGLTDNLNVFAKVGASHFKLYFEDKDTSENVRVDLKNGIYAGVGINGLYPMEKWTMGPFSFGIGFNIQANGALNDVEEVSKADETATSSKGTLYNLDGENSLYVTCKYDIAEIKTSIIPYMGAYQSWVVVGTLNSISYQRASQKNADESNDFYGAFDVLSFGLLLGLDVEIAKYVCLNVEGRFIGETAVTTGATVKF